MLADLVVHLGGHPEWAISSVAGLCILLIWWATR